MTFTHEPFRAIEPEWSAEVLPLVVFPRSLPALASASTRGGRGWSQALRRCAERYLPRVGSILFRGFDVQGAVALERFGELFGASLAPLPAGAILSQNQPGRLWLGCCGESTLRTSLRVADKRELYRCVSPELRMRFTQRGLRYARVLGEAHRRWQDVFETTSRTAVEAWCSAHDLAFAWQPGDTLRLERPGAVIRQHPRTGTPLWADATPLWQLAQGVHEGQTGLADVARAPAAFELRYADGSAVEADVVEEILAAFTECATDLDIESGDVLLVDDLVISLWLPAAQERTVCLATDTPGSARLPS